MKITLDLSRLVKDGSLSREEANRLIALSRREDSSHALSILTVLALIAMVLGFIGLNYQLFVDLVISLYDLLGSKGLHILALMIVSFGSFRTKSGFLAGINAFIILSLLGSSTFYSHAAYFVSIREPALTVLLFSVLAMGGLSFSHNLPYEDERLVLIFARTCLIIVNLGFWIGSLWGSKLGSSFDISREIFCVLWALGLLGVGYWGAAEGRRFVVNTAAVFGSIHFYTQWFERLGASPGTLFIAGIIALAIVYGIRKYNQKF